MTHPQQTDQQPKQKKSNWFARTRRQLGRDNLDRNYYGLADQIWFGMNDIWWAVTHPHKAIPRNIGQLMMLVVVASGLGAAGYLFFGEPNTARVDLEEPSSLLKVATDHTVRPIARFLRKASTGAAEGLNDTEDDGYAGEDYRE